MERTDNVHIAPLGGENDRITEPPIEYGADSVVLLDFMVVKTDPLKELHESVERTLTDAGIDVEVRTVDMSDLFGAIAAFGETIVEYSNERVYVNLASGTKISAIAGMIACMVTNDAEPYYVRAEHHDSWDVKPAKGVTDVKRVPSYRIERPEDQHIAIMDRIAHADTRHTLGDENRPYCNKKTLFEFGEDHDLPFLRAAGADITDKAKHRHLNRHVIDPLTEWGLIEIESVGTEKRVMLSDYGEETLQAFRYVLDRPNDQQLAVLNYIRESDKERTLGSRARPHRTKRQLCEFGTERGLPFASTGERETTAARGDEEVIGPLEERGLVAVERTGDICFVMLTDAGEAAVERYEYVLNTTYSGTDGRH